jgi:LmbE family N-acetylglucosaminyl deacetylase
VATIVSLHAHPDDEVLLTGGWLAARAAAGDRVVLVFATDGDVGLAGSRYSGRSLGQVRRMEATASAAALGVAHVVWLGYADSGMTDPRTADPSDAPGPDFRGADGSEVVERAGTGGRSVNAPISGARRFVDVSVDDAARVLAAVLDEEAADILTGYDANGGYGHPDHVHVHRVARRAQAVAASRPRLLEATVDRTWLVRLLKLVGPAARLLPGLTIAGDDIFTRPESVTLAVDVRPHLEAKQAALAAHASQRSGGIRTVAILLALPRPLAPRVLGTEWFVEVP